MEVRNCKECGKMTPVTARGICRICYEKLEADFLVVREYIKDNPGVAIGVVVEATGVVEKRVREFIRAGRIEVKDMSDDPIQCQKCGKPIARGAYCQVCQSELSKGMASGIGQAMLKSSEDEKETSLISKYRKRRGY